MIAEPGHVIVVVEEQINLDAYHMYPDSKRLIPEMVVWGFASACLLEFVKGLVDFNQLGKGIRTKVEGLLKAWREKHDFEDYLKSEGIEAAVLATIEACPSEITAAQRQDAVERVASALIDLGLPAKKARQHAEQVAKAIAEAISDAERNR